MDENPQLDATFAALANPTRRAILARLAQGEATVNTLAAPFEMSLPAISKHIRVLQDAGLITRSKTAQFRPCAINPAALTRVADWAAQYHHIWADRFDTMGGMLAHDKEPTDD